VSFVDNALCSAERPGIFGRGEEEDLMGVVFAPAPFGERVLDDPCEMRVQGRPGLAQL
jgi:hypothetical protein